MDIHLEKKLNASQTPLHYFNNLNEQIQIIQCAWILLEAEGRRG